MGNELDDLLNQLRDQKKEKEEEAYNERRAHGKYIAAFRQVLKSHIHPAMVPLLDKFRQRNCTALVLSKRKERSNPMTHLKGFDQPPPIDAKNQLLYNNFETYYLGGGQLVKSFGIVITVLGNYALQKVCIFTTYLNFSPTSKTVALKTTEQQYELEEMVPELFETLVTKALKELIALKQASEQAE